jgi:hypothetical protein
VTERFKAPNQLNVCSSGLEGYLGLGDGVSPWCLSALFLRLAQSTWLFFATGKGIFIS